VEEQEFRLERKTQGGERMTHRPVRSYERRLAISFGGITLSAMLIFSLVTLVLNARTQAQEENRLAASLAGTLSEAIGRVSFSGKYQTRLLVQEMQAKNRELDFIAVDDLDGRLIAHSTPELNDTNEDADSAALAKQSIESGTAALREYTAPNGKYIKEVAVPYKGGMYGEVLGVVRAGMDISDIRRARITLTILLCAIGLLLTGFAIFAVFYMGKRFGGEMRSLADKLDGIVENSPIAMAIFAKDGSVNRLNRKFVDLFGYSPEELPNVRDWYPLAYPDPEYREKITGLWEQSVRGYLENKKPFSAVEARVHCKNGEKKDVEFFFEAIGDIFVTTFNDVTERKKSEAERLTMERQMLHVQKLESLGVLAGGMAHDFNNILMAIMGHADLARLRLRGDPHTLKNLDEIVNASRRASDLSRQMLAYSGRGKFVIETVDISSLISEIAQLLSASISKRSKLILNLQSDLPAVEADATQLRQVIMNLITNASESIGDTTGEITVDTGRDFFSHSWLDEAILGSEIPEGDYIFLRIKDTGCGMDEATLSRIFEPFFTTKFTGRGLGMAAVLGIIKGHHGAIRIRTAQGKGSEFTVILPPADHKTSARKPETGTWRGNGTILLVDDEESIRSVSIQMLELLGFTAMSAADGEEALRIYAKKGDTIDLVLLDLTMPGMDGVQTLKMLRELNSDVRVVISSGYTEMEIGGRFRDMKILGFIQKPYDQTQLSEALQRAMGSQRP
jgi:PAS domain S-box-containing protein